MVYQAESFLTMFCGDAIDNVNHQTITLITLNDSQFFIYKKNENEITKYVLFTEFENSESVIKKYYVESKRILMCHSLVKEPSTILGSDMAYLLHRMS